MISIHALREEGDALAAALRKFEVISIHALREEGDSRICTAEKHGTKFLSTPSARRATLVDVVAAQAPLISIHALREEGDSKLADKIGIIIS